MIELKNIDDLNEEETEDLLELTKSIPLKYKYCSLPMVKIFLASAIHICVLVGALPLSTSHFIKF